MARIPINIAEHVGRTPIVELTRICPEFEGQLIAKLESFNPGGSVKDRIGLRMIEAAERDGLLRPGGTIVEPTSGNTGHGLAIAAAIRGYKCIFVMPDKMSQEKISLLRAYGAEVVITPTAVPPESPESYYRVADRLTEEIPGAFQPNQYANPANPEAHRRTTGPELWEQTAGQITHFVAGVGTGGTISGTGRYLKDVSEGRVKVIGADPEGSVYSGGSGRPYLVEGVGEDFWPEAYDRTVADVLDDKAHGHIPSLVHMHPDETVGQAIEVLREYGVSQMPIVKPGAGHPDVMAAEVVGSVVERELLDALFTQRASLDDSLEKHMSAPLPQVGSGEPVADLMSVLGVADAAIVLVEGKPKGVVSRQDLLAFLAKGGKQ